MQGWAIVVIKVGKKLGMRSYNAGSQIWCSRPWGVSELEQYAPESISRTPLYLPRCTSSIMSTDDGNVSPLTYHPPAPYCGCKLIPCVELSFQTASAAAFGDWERPKEWLALLSTVVELVRMSQEMSELL